MDVEVPRTIGLLWGRDEPGRRGPKRSLDVVRIGEAAIRIADKEGLGAVSMKRVAAELGVSTMALYRYVEGKDDLFVVMLEVGSGGLREKFSSDWRAAMEEWCRDYRALLFAHPWVLQVPLAGPPATPRQLDWMEAAVLGLEDSGLTVPERMQVLLQLNAYVRGDAALNLSLVDAGMSPDGWPRLIRELADPERYAAVLRVIETGEFDEDDDPMEQFEFGLARILDGIELLVESRRKG